MTGENRELFPTENYYQQMQLYSINYKAICHNVAFMKFLKLNKQFTNSNTEAFVIIK